METAEAKLEKPEDIIDSIWEQHGTGDLEETARQMEELFRAVISEESLGRQRFDEAWKCCQRILHYFPDNKTARSYVSAYFE